jgi:hypothetical protein
MNNQSNPKTRFNNHREATIYNKKSLVKNQVKKRMKILKKKSHLTSTELVAVIGVISKIRKKINRVYLIHKWFLLNILSLIRIQICKSNLQILNKQLFNQIKQFNQNRLSLILKICLTIF